MSYITVSGAYGRDYRSAAAALKDWNDGKDFVIRTIGYPTYIDKSSADEFDINIRYDHDRKVCEVYKP